MDALVQDLKYALRRVVSKPAANVLIIAMIALGVGANTAIFSVVNSVIIRPLPYPEPDKLVMVWEHNIPRNRPTNVVNPVNYLDWRERARSFDGLAMFGGTAIILTGGAGTERVSGRAVTHNYFTILGVAPALGRTFTPDETRPDQGRTLVLSHALWQRRLGGDTSVVGKTVEIAGGTARVVGVMPPEVVPMQTEAYWEALRLDESSRQRRGRSAMVLGRLKPGIPVEQAHREMVAIAADLERENPAFNTGWSANVVPLTDQLVGSSKRILLMLLGAVGLVLLITCANVGNLMLAKSAARHRESSVRIALGAPRWRLARQWVSENVLLALTGGVAGLGVASWSVSALIAAAPTGIPRLNEITLDMRVFGVAAALSVLVGVAISLPSLFSRDGADVAQFGTARVTSGRAAARFRNGLVVTQVALALVLLTGAGLLVRSIQKLVATDAGFDPANLVSMPVTLPGALYGDANRVDAFYASLFERVRAMPGVEAAGSVDVLPLTSIGSATSIYGVGLPEPVPGQAAIADIRISDSGYFATMRIALLEGRTFTSFDRATSPKVIVVNDALAKTMWPGESAVGKRMRVGMWEPDAEPEIIGVVRSVVTSSLEGGVRSMVYYPRTQAPGASTMLAIRSRRSAAALAPELHAAVAAIDKNVPAAPVTQMETWIARSMTDRRYSMFVLGTFAALAALLAALGIYGVLSFTVGQRTREIGVRVALGAQRTTILGLVLRGGVGLTAAGIAIGTVAALFASRALGNLLYQTSSADPLILAAGALLLGGVALLATYLPARRAARVDPMIALRSE